MIRDFVLGVYDGFRGAAYLLAHPRLWGWVLAPAVVAGIVLVLAVGGLVTWLSAPLAAVAAFLPGHWGENVMKLLVGLAGTVLSITIFISFAALIAGPFNEELSESLEEHETGVAPPKWRLGRFLWDLAVGLVHSARRAFAYLLVIVALLIVGVAVPVAGTIAAAVLGFIATARFASYDAYDAVFARRRFKYRAKLAYLREHRWRTLGLGAVVALPLLVPGVNILGLAIGATAATLRMIDQRDDAKPPR